MTEYLDKGLKRFGISISKPILAAVSIVAGVAVILFPDLLVWTVGLLLVVQGALLLTNHFGQERPERAVKLKGVYCRNCGVGNAEGSIFCKACGKELFQEAPVAVLPAQEIVH